MPATPARPAVTTSERTALKVFAWILTIISTAVLFAAGFLAGRGGEPLAVLSAAAPALVLALVAGLLLHKTSRAGRR